MAIISNSVPVVDKAIGFRLEGDLKTTTYRVVETLMQVPIPAITSAGGSQGVSIPLQVSGSVNIQATTTNSLVTVSANPQSDGTILLIAQAAAGQTAAASTVYLSVKDFEPYK